MDPLSMLVSALVSGATSSIENTSSQAIKDAYTALKNKLSTLVTKTLPERLEEDPNNKANRAYVEQKLAESGCANDKDVQTLVETLTTLLQDQNKLITIRAEHQNIDISGNSNVVVANNAGQIHINNGISPLSNDEKIQSLRQHENYASALKKK